MQLFRHLLIILFASMLWSCGSGGGTLTQDGGDGTLGDPPVVEEPPPEPVYKVTLELLNANGEVSQHHAGFPRCTRHTKGNSNGRCCCNSVSIGDLYNGHYRGTESNARHSANQRAGAGYRDPVAGQ